MADGLVHHWTLSIIWAVSLLAVWSMATSAQVRPSVPLVTEGPTIISGNDVGFRIERTQNGIPIGSLVVRVDGRWVDTGTSERVAPVR
jgi:hypothetical protein